MAQVRQPMKGAASAKAREFGVAKAALLSRESPEHEEASLKWPKKKSPKKKAKGKKVG